MVFAFCTQNKNLIKVGIQVIHNLRFMWFIQILVVLLRMGLKKIPTMTWSQSLLRFTYVCNSFEFSFSWNIKWMKIRSRTKKKIGT